MIKTPRRGIFFLPEYDGEIYDNGIRVGCLARGAKAPQAALCFGRMKIVVGFGINHKVKYRPIVINKLMDLVFCFGFR